MHSRVKYSRTAVTREREEHIRFRHIVASSYIISSSPNDNCTTLEYLSNGCLRFQTRCLHSPNIRHISKCIYVTNFKSWYQTRDAFTRQIFRYMYINAIWICAPCGWSNVTTLQFCTRYCNFMRRCDKIYRINVTHFISSSNSVKVNILHWQSALRHDVSMMRYLSWFGK